MTLVAGQKREAQYRGMEGENISQGCKIGKLDDFEFR
jgi:hypothetical protein